MDYLGVYLDQRTALSHHGTEGMQWGVWNDETLARYLGLRKRTPRTYGEGLRENINRLGLVSGLADTKIFGNNRGYSRSEIRNQQARAKLYKRILDMDTRMLNDIDETKIRNSNNASKAKNELKNQLRQAQSDSKDSKTDGIDLKRDVRSMTTDELNAAANRLNAEDRYNQAIRARKEANKSFGGRIADAAVSSLKTSVLNETSNLVGKLVSVPFSRLTGNIDSTISKNMLAEAASNQKKFFDMLDAEGFNKNSSPQDRVDAYASAWEREQKNPGLYERILKTPGSSNAVDKRDSDVGSKSGSSTGNGPVNKDTAAGQAHTSANRDRTSEQVNEYKKAARESKRETRDFERSYKYWTDDDFKKYGDEFQRKSQEDLNRWGSEFRNDSSTISSGSAFSQTYSDYDYTWVDDDSTTWSR